MENHGRANEMDPREFLDPQKDSNDVFFREADCAFRLGISVKCLRNWADQGYINVFSPFGSKVRIYYWPAVKRAIFQNQNIIQQELEPVGKL